MVCFVFPFSMTLKCNDFVRAMVRDEKAYPDASTFNPERFLKDGKINPDVQNPLDVVFGFGRRLLISHLLLVPLTDLERNRICPGLHVAETVFKLTAAHVVFAFEISKKHDDRGRPIEPACEYTEDFVR
jgi:cytochrome P450